MSQLQTWALSRLWRSKLHSSDVKSDMTGTNETNELQAILTDKAEVCLLIDSPYRILRVSKKKAFLPLFDYQCFRYCAIITFSVNFNESMQSVINELFIQQVVFVVVEKAFLHN